MKNCSREKELRSFSGNERKQVERFAIIGQLKLKRQRTRTKFFFIFPFFWREPLQRAMHSPLTATRSPLPPPPSHRHLYFVYSFPPSLFTYTSFTPNIPFSRCLLPVRECISWNTRTFALHFQVHSLIELNWSGDKKQIFPGLVYIRPLFSLFSKRETLVENAFFFKIIF